MRALSIFTLAVLLLLTAASAAGAANVVTAKGVPTGAKKLASPVTLPNGQTSSYTFTLRKTSNGAKVTGYAVSATKYYESLNFSEYYRVPRSAAFAAFNGDFAYKAKLVYTRLSAGGTTYNVLSRVYYDIVGE
jgi:hypothetical protein